LLLDMCAVDTTPNADVSVMREQENRVFDQIRGYLASPRCRLEHRPISPEIAQHPAFSLLHFTKTPENPDGLSPDEAYRGRGNLLAFMDADGGRGVAVNAHIDVIAPFFPPRRQGDTSTDAA
jgi:hypothetical protein